MLKEVALLFAVLFIVAGIITFIPLLTPNQLLFNLFEVSASHSLLYIITGLIALSASTSPLYTKWFFRMCGLLYGLLALFGLALDGHFGFLHFNVADHLFHLVIAMIALYLGFTLRIAKYA